MIGTNCVSCYGCRRRLILVGGYVRRCWQSNCKHKCAFVSLIITHHFIANTINGWKHVNKESSCVCRSIWVQPEVREGGGLSYAIYLINWKLYEWITFTSVSCVLYTLNGTIQIEFEYLWRQGERRWMGVRNMGAKGGGGGEPKSDELTIYISSSKLNCNLLWCMLS